MKEAEPISSTVRRRFVLGKQGLWPGRRWSGKEGTAAALQAVEAVQVDPVSVVAPSADIVLYGRVAGYRPAYLATLLHDERRFFDFGALLMIYPIGDLPYWRVRMARRKGEERQAGYARAHAALLDEVRQAVRDHGPLRNRDLDGRAVTHYRAGKDTGVALYHLWLTGELMIHSRHGKERVYDFLENVAPPDLQWTAREEEATLFFTRKAISHWGFVDTRRFRAILKVARNQNVSTAAAQESLEALVAAGELAVVDLAQEKRQLYYLAADEPLLQDLRAGRVPAAWQPLAPATTEEVVFLSPLEFVSARGRARELFDFDYIWEIYKPARERVYGPYTMPVLYGDRLVARMDARLDRQQSTLRINGFWPESWFEVDARFSLAFARGLRTFATFLDAGSVDTTALQPPALRAAARRHL